ncbi:hypothetical protein FXF46_16425 (plasmid) [Gluconobacter thailandicus]|uniref:Lipoprotein n=1 Tax=Gluconobacter thailandicus TaxID=257438 RepID=A0AAP9EX14_GLUTH|nr:hypothetical protein FXF46_16425 [Gluconobacter thailandicus]
MPKYFLFFSILCVLFSVSGCQLLTNEQFRGYNNRQMPENHPDIAGGRPRNMLLSTPRKGSYYY